MDVCMKGMSLSEVSSNAVALPYNERIELMKILVDSLRIPDRDKTPKDEEYWDRIAKKYQGCMKDLWDGIDPLEYQRSLRAEWDRE